MRKNEFLLVLLLCFNSAIIAQKPAEVLTKWSDVSPVEKTYLHFDRDNYVAGETAWFKAYLYSDHQPDTISTTLYVEFLKDSVALISRVVLPVFIGIANGQIELPDSLATGHYLVRAYTSSMLNHDAAFLYQRRIFVFGKNNMQAAGGEKTSNRINVEFFPEGGNLVNGFTNTIAFKATDSKGLPVAATGTIRNAKNEEVATFNSYHDGMGMFELHPVANGGYYALLNGDASAEKYFLPAAVDKGIVLTVLPHPQGNFFELQQKTGDPSFEAVYMIGQMQQRVVFQQNFSPGKEAAQGVINTQNLHSGILQITVFNKDNVPLAERLCFVNNREYIVNAELKADTIDFSPRSRNRFTLLLKDTVQGSFSVSVTDNEQSHLPAREENIFTSLLLTSDIRGYVHNPAYYFSSGEDAVKNGLDLVMMTNGWRRFRWEQLLKTGAPAAGFKDKAYITLAGKANYRGLRKPFADKQLILFITGIDGKRSTQFIETDEEGGFLIDSLIFFDRTRLLFSDVRGKKSQYIDILLNGDSVRRQFQLPGITKYRFGNDLAAGTNARWKMDYDAMIKANGILLEEIKLKSINKNPLQQVDERYTRGMFSGDASKAIDLVNTDEASSYQNIFDYLQARVNGLQVSADGFDYSVFYRQSASMSAMGAIPMALFLDEIETDASVIATIPASQVALVKVYNSFSGAWGNAPGGLLAVYTKKGEDYLNSTGSSASNKIYNGYSVIKEFYTPDYKNEKEDDKADTRTTLQWRPNIIVNSINATVPVSFYNSDRAKQYRIVVEGMTASGKMLSIEKIISTGKKSF